MSFPRVTKVELSAAFLSLLLLLPAAADAGVELTLGMGVRYGDAGFPIEATGPLIVCVTTPCILAEATTTDGQAEFSLILDVPISRRWMVEALFTQQDGDLELGGGSSPAGYDQETFESTTAQVGLLRHWGEGRIQPFAAGALGITRFQSSAMAYDRPFFPGIVARPVDEEVFSGSLAGGVKVALASHLALRLEGRAYWHDLPELVGGRLQQNEASAGVTVRW